MKRLILALTFMLTLTVANAQKSDKFSAERFHAELEQYITTKAGLTPKEAAKFFPLYKEMRKKQRAIHDEMKSLKRIKPSSNSDCKKNIRKRDQLEVEMKQIQKTYHEKFMNVLSAKKVYDILRAEDKFHRQMFKKSTGKNNKKK